MNQRYYDIHDNGYNVRCKLYCSDPKAIRRAVIFGHGFGGHKDNKAAERFASYAIGKHSDMAVIVFNWPCHGDDMHKHLDLSSCDQYLTMVLRDAREHLHAERLDAYATSFGGYLFLRYIAHHGNPFTATVLRCPAVDMYAVLTHAIMNEGESEQIQKGKDAMVGFDRKIRVERAFLEELQREPMTTVDFTSEMDRILILHGTEDEVVPFEMVQHFADENLIELIPVEGADHRFRNAHHMDEAIKATLLFMESLN
ncbi:MAG: alpha/beta fold hydrolase [Clostridia bacterium]|nr:alpha/beta fold hydrolase [Clostridia bacterium]